MATFRITPQDLQGLLDHLQADAWKIIGPRERDGGIFFDALQSVDQLPQGRGDRQEAGTYQLIDNGTPRYFGFNQGADSFKRHLFPPQRKLLTMHRDGRVEAPAMAEEKKVFLGIRGCDLAAISIQDRVFLGGENCDPQYAAKRNHLMVIAVNCSVSAPSCFCTSMDTGPRINGTTHPFDLCLTEVLSPSHGFLVEVGSEAGKQLAAALSWPSNKQKNAEEAINEETENAAKAITRRLAPEVRKALPKSLKDEIWQDIAQRCLSCGNCTMVCPTCFCQSTEDRPNMDFSESERWVEWDSCFHDDHSYIHGGNVRRSTADRYRQWMLHKLSSWHDQFGTPGCTGCGRCTSWCPVGIDFVKEANNVSGGSESE